MPEYYHPQRQAKEEYIGDKTKAEFKNLHWKTKRLGNPQNWSEDEVQKYPVFVSREEIRKHARKNKD